MSRRAWAFRWYAGHVYTDRAGECEYYCESEHSFIYLADTGPITCNRRDGLCIPGTESVGDILPSFRKREFGEIPADLEYAKRWMQ